MNWHTFFRLTLAVLILATSQTIAVARGAPAPAGTMVICGGEGVYTITVDAEGNPTGAVHICPDCALSLFAFQDAGAGMAVLHRVWVPVRHSWDRIAQSGGDRPTAVARGPPLVV